MILWEWRLGVLRLGLVLLEIGLVLLLLSLLLPLLVLEGSWVVGLLSLLLLLERWGWVCGWGVGGGESGWGRGRPLWVVAGLLLVDGRHRGWLRG